MEITYRPIGALMLRGKSQPIEVFEPLATPPAWLDAYAAAFEALRHGEPAAILNLHAAHPQDAVLAPHAGRIARGETPALITA
jgi:adenylate cyclase